MRHLSNSSGACPDPLVLQRWCDAELSPAEVARVGDHVAACADCRARCERLERDLALVTVRLGEEDEVWAAEAGDALEDVHRRLAREVSGRGRRGARHAWPWRAMARLRHVASGRTVAQLAAGAAVLAAAILVTAVSVDHWSVGASAERVLTEARVRERAWRYQSGKLRVQTVEHDLRVAGDPPRRWVTTTWFNNVVGQESYTARSVDPSGQLVGAWWMRTDGWSARFVANGSKTLTLDPPMSDLERLVPGLPPAQRLALESWRRDRRRQVRPQELAAVFAARVGEAVAPDLANGGPGRPQLLRVGPVFLLTYQVAETSAGGARATWVVEDTLAAADLVHERSFQRLIDDSGEVLREVERRLVHRQEGDPAEFARLMAEVEHPPADWKVRRRTPTDVLADALRLQARLQAAPSQRRSPTGRPDPPPAAVTR